MAKKKKHEEHENLERWLVSYSDFITLLFATFVVLYALSQVDLSDYTKLQDSIKAAFSTSSLLTGQESVMNGSENMFDESTMANSFIPTLMFEYMNAKYEEKSFQEIAKSIEELLENHELDGVSAELTERGLLLTFDDQYLFKSGSAQLSASAKVMLDKVGVLVYEKFILHNMRIEGHTDKAPISTFLFPSNWELSSARACAVVRYLISRFKFFPELFTAVGYADTRPIADNNTTEGAEKNRRIEIMILKNKYKEAEKPSIDLKNFTIAQQVKIQEEREKIVKDIKISTKMGDLDFKTNKSNKVNKEDLPYTKLPSKSVIEKNHSVYESLNKDLKFDETIPIIRLDSKIPTDEDFGI